MALIIPEDGLSISPCRDFTRCGSIVPLHQTQMVTLLHVENPGSHRAFRDIRLSKNRRLWCAYHEYPELRKSKGRWTGPCPARQGKALPAFLVPVARELWMADVWESGVSRSGQEWERRKQMGDLGPAFPTGAAEVAGCGVGLYSFCSTVTYPRA